METNTSFYREITFAYTHTHLYAKLSEFKSCAVLSVMCTFKIHKSYFSALVSTQSDPHKPFTCSAGGPWYSFTISVAFGTPIIYHLYRFCAIETKKNEDYRVGFF